MPTYVCGYAVKQEANALYNMALELTVRGHGTHMHGNHHRLQLQSLGCVLRSHPAACDNCLMRLKAAHGCACTIFTGDYILQFSLVTIYSSPGTVRRLKAPGHVHQRSAVRAAKADKFIFPGGNCYMY